MKAILCESNPMCYGSSIVLLSIMQQIKMKTICLAYGVAYEVLKDSNFDLIEVNNKSSVDVKEAIKLLDFDCVLVVSNLSNIKLYKSLNKRIYFVHTLYFLPNAHDDRINLVDFFFVQNFWNLKKSNFAIKTGPLIKVPKKRKNKNNFVLVNFGGGESKFIQPGLNSDYGLLMLELIIQIKNSIKNKEIIVCGGNKIINTIKLRAIENNINPVSLSNEIFLRFLDQSELLISSPGTCAIFEAMYRDIPIVFLPPQNVSQVFQLKEYENAGIAVNGLNLTIPDGFLTEEEQTNNFLIELTEKYNNYSFVKEQLKVLKKQFEYIKTTKYKNKLLSAKKFLGEIGTKKISNIINNDFG